ncbi:MAG: hypothetical protein H6742_16360 [Alphaproteobacteria bacterium]|nr:hypothetical protein [Alphaproteobacteria bacterium]
MVSLFLLLLAAPASAHELTVLAPGDGPPLIVEVGGRAVRSRAIDGGRRAVIEVQAGDEVVVRDPRGLQPWSGVAPDGDATIGIRAAPGRRLERVPLALDQGQVVEREADWSALAGGGIGLVVLLFMGLRVALPEALERRLARWRWWWTPLVFAALSALWTWPAVLLSPDRVPGRHFDILPVIWLVERVPGGLPGSHWPVGEALQRVDSWLLLLFALLPLSGVTVAGLLAWLGPALSAWAAEVCARRAFGVAAPHSLIAGVTYGFSGIVASALLEGHVPHLLQPWLPLTLGAAWLARERGWRMALLAGLGAALSLLTTGYHGVAAVLMIAVLAVRAPVLLLAALPVALAAVPIAANLGGGGEVHVMEIVPRGSLSLWTLATWTGQVDRFDHSVSAPIGVLALTGLVLGRNRWLQLLCGLALVLAFGPTLRLVPWDAGVQLPWAALYGLGLGDVLRFPIRFMWVLFLCAGVLAAAASARRPAIALPMLAVLGALEAGTPFRQRPGALPTVTVEREGAVLDLFPVAVGLGPSDIDMWARALSCVGQISHGQPVLARCLGTGGGDVRERVADRVMADLLEGRGVEWVAEAGVGTIVLHPGWFRDQDARDLAAALDWQLGAASEQEDLLVWTVPGEPVSAEAALEALSRRGTLR